MNKEIKFRGLRLDGGGWAYGNYFHWVKRGNIIHCIGSGIQNGSMMGHPVTPVTIGQYTGLLDKNGKEIYKGDKIDTGNCLWEVYFGDNQCYGSDANYGWCVKALRTGKTYPIDKSILKGILFGNIYENRDLLI